ncbi:uncharacterized protein PAF06_007080 [Gastrophryne carolinensis]
MELDVRSSFPEPRKQDLHLNVTSHEGNSTTIAELLRIVFPVLYLIIFLASVMLNGLAVWIFFHIRNKTSFILYLKNIIVADLLMTSSFPFKIIQTSGIAPWHFNVYLCRYTSILFYTSMYICIVFLGLISIDRYLKVVKPFGSSKMYSIKFTKMVSVCVWIVMFLFALPNVILTNVQPTRDNMNDCRKLKSPFGAKWHEATDCLNVLLFFTVMVVLIVCYISISRHIQKSSKPFVSCSSRTRRHNQSIRVVVTVFFVSFLPYHLCGLPFLFNQLDIFLDKDIYTILVYCKEAALFLSACNVCLDPIIYFFTCRSFSQRLFNRPSIRSRSESIKSLQSVRKSEVRIYCEYTEHYTKVSFNYSNWFIGISSNNNTAISKLKMNNFTELNVNYSERECFPNADVITKVLPTLYAFIFFIGISLNGINLWIFCYIPSNKSFIVYLKNIVIADLLMTLTFPMKIISDAGFGDWQLRLFVCRYSAVMFYLNMYIGIIFLGTLGFDRYYKIVRPMNNSSFQSVYYSKIISVLIWALMAFISVPNMILTNKFSDETTEPTCAKLKSKLGIQWHMASNYISISIFVLVFVLLLLFYVSISRKIYRSHQKFKRGSNAGRKSKRNIYSILIVFFICFVPYHLCRIPYTISQTASNDYTCQQKTSLYYIKEVTLLLSAANVCLDPVIYFFMCQPFRQMLLKKLHIEKKLQETEKTCRASSTQPAII